VPHLSCPGGHDINLSRLPNPAGYAFIREPDLEPLARELSELCDSGSEFASSAYSLLMPGHPNIRQIYECPECGRLALFAHPSDHVPLRWYVSEPFDDRPAGQR
jgi:hypothetical protein